jgi:glutamate--cysteine ligase catalytic subunit
MGCCCLQVTIQAQSDGESRFLHDQLAIMAPIMLAVSASTPIHKGHLVNTDTRWDVISQAVDDRRQMEMGINDGTVVQPSPQLAGNGIKRLKKSRYSSISRYITKTHNDDEANALKKLNDIDAGIDEESYKMLIDAGIDESLASHIAHLFTRDPLVIFEDSIYLDDNRTLDHFENIQSTNWRSMRWKTPCLEMGYAAEKAIDSKVNDKDTSNDMALESTGIITIISTTNNTNNTDSTRARMASGIPPVGSTIDRF